MRLRLLIVSLVAIVLLFSGIRLLYIRQMPKPLPARVQADVTLEGRAVGQLNADEVREIVLALARAQKQGPVNAGFRENSPGFTPEVDGITVNVEATVQAVLHAPAQTAVPLTIQRVKPLLTMEKLQQARLAGQAETPLLDTGANRIHNIGVAARCMDNTIVMPGEICSFNNIIGNTTAERGYREAPILENGQKAMGIGGGVCQISSTLYNAVMAGGLPVTERHPHSKPVEYVAAGKDAATSEDKDFKFRNNRRGPLVLHILITGAAVRTEIWEISEVR